MPAEKKLSAKTIIGNVLSLKNAMIKDGVKHRDLFTMIGVASAYECGVSQMGDWTALTGEFEATNLESGDVFTAFKAFLPRDITNYFVAGLKQANGNVIEFAVKVGIRLTDTPIGYEYTVEALIPLKASSSLQRLRAEAAKVHKALPAASEKTDKKVK